MRLLLTFLLLAGATGIRAAGSPTSQVLRAEVSRTITYEYLQWLPAAYDPAAGRRWPLLVFLHGAGERGTDIQLIARHGPPKLLAAGSTLNTAETAAGRSLAEKFIVIAPQCPVGQVWDDDAVLALVETASRQLEVDGARIYLTGLSMGGYGTWSLAMKQPERFAAIVPICGGGRLLDILISRGSAREAMQTLAVRAFHGAKDPTVPVSESERMIETLRRAGARDIELKVYPEAKHDSWTETYASAELYDWLLRHSRAAPAKVK